MVKQESIEKPRRKRKVLRTLLIVLVVIIACFVVFRLVLRSRLHARLDAIRADGYPATCAELDDWYTIPESAENAADTFRDSFSRYEKWEGEEKRKLLPIIGEAELPLRTEPLTEETKILVTQYLADNKEALELLHKGAAMEHSRYPIDLSKGFETLMPDLRNVRDGAKIFELEAVLHAENGKPEQAFESITSTFGLARSLSQEPLLISQLVRVACQGLAVSTLEHTVNRIDFTDEQLADLSQTLVSAEDPSAMTRAFVGERCAGLSIFKMPAAQILRAADGGSSPLAVIAIALYKFSGLADMDIITYTDVMDDYLKAIQLPLHKRRDATDTIDEDIKNISRIHIYTRLFLPALSRVTTLGVRNIAQLHTSRAGLAVQRYRITAGRLPDTLTELVPAYLDAVPKDPFDGEELRYKKLETGFVVYSIGEDGNDDGGKEKPRKRSGPDVPVDVTFIIQR